MRFSLTSTAQKKTALSEHLNHVKNNSPMASHPDPYLGFSPETKTSHDKQNPFELENFPSAIEMVRQLFDKFIQLKYFMSARGRGCVDANKKCPN